MLRRAVLVAVLGLLLSMILPILTASIGSYFPSQSFAATPTIGWVATVPTDVDEVQAIPAPDNTQIAIFNSIENENPDKRLWYVTRLGADAKPPYADAVAGPGYIHRAAIGTDSTVYMLALKLEDPGGLLLKLAPGAQTADIVKSWDTGILDSVEFYEGKVYVVNLDSSSGTCTSTLNVFGADGSELKTLANPAGCGGRLKAAANLLTAYDYTNSRIAYFNPDTLDVNFQSLPAGTGLGQASMASDGSYAFTSGSACTRARAIRIAPSGLIYDKPLSQVFTSFGTNCYTVGTAMLSDGTSAIAIKDFDTDTVNVGLLDANGTVLQSPVGNETSTFVTTITADGSGKFILATEREKECGPDSATPGSKKCYSLHVEVYDQQGLVSTDDAGGQWGRSIYQQSYPSVKDGSIAFPVQVLDCSTCGDNQRMEIVQIPAPVTRINWDDLAIDEMTDRDGDALPDIWEVNGVTITPELPGGQKLAPQFIDLPAMGADPDRADIFVHLSWMKGLVNGVMQDMKLSSGQIEKVVTAFDKSPYVSANGARGINLHVDQGPDSINYYGKTKTWGTLSQAKEIPIDPMLGYIQAEDGEYNWGDFDKIKHSGFTPTGRVPVFRYALAAYKWHPNEPKTGFARGRADMTFYGFSDFMLSLGAIPAGSTSEYKVFQQGATLMHELGHNLSLRHGGGDDINNKPNYLSIMNYYFDRGLIKDGKEWNLDYSRNKLLTLNEWSLDETAGMGSSIYDSFRYCHWWGYPKTIVNFVKIGDPDHSINWDCDVFPWEKDVIYDINYDDNIGEKLETYKSYDDWTNIRLFNGVIGHKEVSPDLPASSPVDNEIPLPDKSDLIIPTAAAHDFRGFYDPVKNYPTKNSVVAGATVPIKFSLGGNKGRDVFMQTYPASRKVSCSTLTDTNPNNLAVAAISSGFTYDAAKDQYIYNWKTEKAWAGTCREFATMFNDGTRKTAIFQFK